MHLTARLRDLCEDDTGRARRFRYGLLAFAVATILHIVVSSFVHRVALVQGLDLAMGVVVLLNIPDEGD